MLRSAIAGVPISAVDEATLDADEGAVLRDVLSTSSPSQALALIREFDASLAEQVIGLRPGPQTTGQRADRPPLQSVTELYDLNLPEIEYVVDGLIPMGGLTILAGRPKVGKSWLALQIGASVSCGREVLGRRVTDGPSIYLCLEDSPRRMRGRSLHQGVPTEVNLRFSYTMERKLDQGGLADFRALVETEEPRLVVLDTFNAATSGKFDENSSGPVGELAYELQDIAQKSNAAVVLIHHYGKPKVGGGADFINDLRGSSALAGAADVIVGLGQTDMDGHAEMTFTGRDIESGQDRVVFNKSTMLWNFVGDSREESQREVREEILQVLSDVSEADIVTIAQVTGKVRNTIQEHVKRMAEVGEIDRRPDPTLPKRFLYSLPVMSRSQGEEGLAHAA